MVLEFFKMLDVRNTGGLDDVEFRAFLLSATDLSSKQIDRVFDIFDWDRSGTCEFDEVPI